MRRRAFAVFAVTMMVVAAIPLLADPVRAPDGDGYTYAVTYHSGNPDVITGYNTDSGETSVTVHYYGVPVAEYNPQFWSDNITGDPVGGNPSDWYGILKYGENSGRLGSWEWHPENVTVFTGWMLASGGNPIDPGEDLSYLFAEGVTSIDLYASWSRANSIYEVDGQYWGPNYEVQYVDFDGGNKYTNLVIMTDDVSMPQGYNYDIGASGSAGFTIRSDVGKSYWLDVSRNDRVTGNPTSNLNTDVIIDNVGLWTNSKGESEHSLGLYAQEHTLIIGTNVTCAENVMVYGGWRSGGSGSTDVRIFSGTYASVYGGSDSGGLSATSVTILGQSDTGTRITNTVYGGSHRGDVTETHILMAGGVMDNHGTGIPIGDSHSNIIGGSRESGAVTVSNVTITNNAVAFAVQGGGRESSTTTTTTHVTVSGKAHVEYMVCGSVTDGNTDTAHVPVTDSHVHITQGATIGSEEGVGAYSQYGYGSVFGGGWDTFKNPLGPSTQHTHLTIDGGTVYGSVYGGGFRGSVGTGSGSVAIDMTGGTVHGSVYGGGRGGTDLMSQKFDDETVETDKLGKYNTTGMAYVLGDVTVSIGGGTVKGNVYGGGYGVAKSDGDIGGVSDCAKVVGDVTVKLSGTAKVNGSVYGGGRGLTQDGYGDAAMVQGHVIVDVGIAVGDSQDDNVYGGGENGKVTGSTDVEVSGSVPGSVYGGGNLGAVGRSTAVTVSGYVTGTVYGGGHQGDVSGGTDVDVTGSVTGSVYGGGENGKVTGSTDVTVGSSGTVSGNLYGGGKGAGAGVGGVSVVVLGNVAGPVYGGGDLGSVSGSVTMEMTSAEVGAVYGGGSGVGGGQNAAAVTGDIRITLNGTRVVGSLFGGGHGVAKDHNTIATVSGDVSVTVSGGSVGGDLYGGGEYGLVEGGTLRITLSGAEVQGSVYSGGMGEKDRKATDLTDRFLTIDGGSVGGSVYGGSRYGNDNLDSDGTAPAGRGSFIYILSGDIAGGSSGNVYGGGYRGYSAMDSHVYIGESAEGSTGLASGAVKVRSVYGGSSVGASDSGMLTAQLLIGDAEVRIGGDSVTITGDVFGAGDFCDISGDADVRFEGFSQEGAMLSVQKADTLTLEDSRVELKGNIDGSSTTGSPMYSLNLIGQLELASVNEKSEIVLDSAASQISGLTSTYGSIPADASGYNVLSINNGMVFSILGTGNAGGDLGTVEGMTLIKSDSNDYFGALVMADRRTLLNDPTFWYATGDGHQQLEFSDYDYGSMGVRAWHLQGAYKVEQTVVFEDGTGASDTMVKDLLFTLPKVSNSSSIIYAGHYVTPSSPGSMELTKAPANPGRDLSVVFGHGAGSGLTLFGEELANGSHAGLNLADLSGNMDSSEYSSGAGLNMRLSLIGGYHSTGYIGSVIVHFAEVSGGIVFNILDVEVKVYLRTSVIPSAGLEGSMVMRGEGPYTGTVDIYLPALPGNATGVYTVEHVESDGGLHVLTVPTNLNRDGWIQTEHRDDPLKLDGDGSVRLGTGGVFSPVLKVTYTTSSINDDGTFEPFKMTVRVTPETGGEPRDIVLTVTPRMASLNTVTFYDKVLDLSSTGSWSQYVPMFSIGVLFGDSVDQYYVVVNKQAWKTDGDALAFIDSIGSSLLTDEDGTVLASTDSQSLEDDASEFGGEVMTLRELLGAILEAKSDTTYNGNLSFDYSEESPGWYDSPEGHTPFDFGSEIANKKVGVYSGYSIALNVEVKNPDCGGDVNQSVLFPGAPGSELDLYGRISVTPGYEITGWWFGDSAHTATVIDPKTDGNGNIISVPFKTYSTTTIYVHLEKVDYSLTVVFDDGSDNPAYPYSVTVNGAQMENWFQVGDSVTITVSNLGTMHISAATGNGNAWNRFTVAADSVSFTAPAMDLEVTIHLSSNYMVTVTLPRGGSTDDNAMFGFSTVGGKELVAGGGLESTTIVSTTSTDGSIQYITIEAPDYTGHTVVLTLYDSDGDIVGSEHSDSVSFPISGLTADVTYTLYVNVLWTVELGKGYTATVDGSEIQTGGTVLTGDMITLTLNESYAFGTGFTDSGATMTSSGTDASGHGYRVYTVNAGDGSRTDVEFGDAEYAMIKVTVKVVFTVGGAPAASQPEGAVKVNNDVLTRGIWASGTLTYTFTALKQTYTFTAEFEGYGDGSVTQYIGEDTTVTIKLTAVAQTVTFTHGGDTLGTYTWYVGDDKRISQMYAGGGYVAWTDGERLLEGGDTLSLDMFSDGSLTLEGLPVIEDVSPKWEVEEILAHEGQLADGLEIYVGEGYGGPVASVDTESASIEGGYLTLKISGGTGSFHVVLHGPETNLILIVTVVGSVGDIGGTGPFLKV